MKNKYPVEWEEYKKRGSKLDRMVATLEDITAMNRSSVHPPRNILISWFSNGHPSILMPV